MFIQKNNTCSKVWLKKDKLHEVAHEEIEIRLALEDFEKLNSLFLALGYTVQIKWFRTSHTFDWDDVKIMLEDTLGYGKIIKLEIMSEFDYIEESLNRLKKLLNRLNIPLTTTQEFDKKIAYYSEHWQELTKIHD